MRYIFVISILLLIWSSSNAQVSARININIGNQPVWGPTGYDYVEYYYFPDIEVYYNVPHHRYYYYDDGHWIGRPNLPPRFHDFDVYHSYKVVVNDPEPYRHHERYRDEYASYRGRHNQPVIRDSRDTRYFVIKDHPEHNNWMKQQHDHGNGKGRGEGHGNKRENNRGHDKHGHKDN